MADVWLWTVIGGGVVSLGVWVAKGQLKSVVTTSDVDPEETPTRAELAEVREMAQSAKRRAEEAHGTAEEARTEIQSLSELLVENTNDVDEPLLVRFQNRLESIEAELQRQSRVETERAVSMGRIAKVLEGMDGVDADAIDMDELREQLPAGGEYGED